MNKKTSRKYTNIKELFTEFRRTFKIVTNKTFMSLELGVQEQKKRVFCETNLETKGITIDENKIIET